MTGFVYIWRDAKHNRYYIGSHWGSTDDGYICSSSWMRRAYKNRPHDFKRRIIARVSTTREDLLKEEERWLSMIKDHELATRNSSTGERNKNVRYYNVSKRAGYRWHTDDKKRMIVSKKISEAKIGKKPNMTAEQLQERGERISESKLRNALERERLTGSRLTEAQKKAERRHMLGKKHTDEWKEENSRRLKEQWATGIRKPRPSKPKEPSRARGERLKELWSDPEWAARQRQRLAEGAKSRPPRSEESKMKARIAQLGKPKPRRVMINTTGKTG